MTTALTLATRARSRVHGIAALGPVTSLAGSLTDVTATFDITGLLADFGQLRAGAVIEVGAEQMLVVTTASTATVTVQRAVNGSTAAAHTSGDLVWVAPRMGLSMILDELEAEIRSWPDTLFTTEGIEVSWSSATATAALNAGGTVYRILAADRMAGSGDSDSRFRTLRPRLLRNMTLGSDFPTGLAIQIDEPWTYDQAVDMRVVVAKAFDLTSFSGDSELEDDCGLEASFLDVAVWGLGYRMLSHLAAHRVDLGRQGQPRDAQEVSAQELALAVSTWKQMRDGRLVEEAARLSARWGVAK